MTLVEQPVIMSNVNIVTVFTKVDAGVLIIKAMQGVLSARLG